MDSTRRDGKTETRRLKMRRPAGGSSLAPASSRPRTLKSVARRNAILDAALDEFSARGFAAARLDEVLSRILGGVRTILRRARERGEIDDDALIRFPQLIGAPGIIAIVWSGLFDRFEPLDVRAMMQAQFNFLFGTRRPQ